MVTKSIYVWQHLRKRWIQLVLQIIKEYVQISQTNSSPWISISLLRFRGKVPSGPERFSGDLRISSSLSCSSFSCCDGNKIKFNLCIYFTMTFNWSWDLWWRFLMLLFCCRSVETRTLSSTLQTFPFSLQEDGLLCGAVLQRKVANGSTEIFCFDFFHHSFGVAQK